MAFDAHESTTDADARLYRKGTIRNVQLLCERCNSSKGNRI